MAHGTKFRKTSGISTSSLQVCTDSREDRLSDLPDDIAHLILSFLSLKEYLILSFVSKRCRDLLLTMPSLNYDAPNRHLGRRMSRTRYMNFFDRILMHRQTNKINSLRIRWALYRDTLYRIWTWLEVAVKCNVEVIDLEITEGRRLQFIPPVSLLCCESLTSLTLNLNRCSFVLPFSTVGFTHLQSLSIKYVKIQNDSFCEWLSTFCKSLKELTLEHIEDVHNITIKISSLERFFMLNPIHLCHLNVLGDMLQIIHVNWRFDSPVGKSLKICAPNLKMLTWNGNPTNNNCVGDFIHLEGVQLFLEPKVKAHQNLPGVLHCIRMAKDLCLHEIITQALFEKGCLPAKLENISLSIIASGLHDDLVRAMVFLLHGMSNLKTLSIKYSSPATHKKVSGFKMNYWVSQNLKFIGQVEVVVIELFNGDNELELAKYLLRYGKKLKKMSILHSLPLPSNIITKLNKYRKCSSTVIAPQKK
ncbi:F-box domain-containing protein [Cephalotus follicularis]|uniref:F-box domain-containing protein n=1 Tax=Cephalotus follicularis TaxID=3775 RepID=A0A1Q3ALX1_CEPFO|nr:F-box domain-containing protein [Cephalotus follicularis]